MKKRIAIVGGGGFIGHNLALELKKKFKVYILDNLLVNNLYSVIMNTDKIPNPNLSKYIIEQRLDLIEKNKINFLFCDARNYHELSYNLDKVKPDIIIHLAAVSHSNRANKTPLSTFDHSLRTLENSLDYSKKSVKHFIFFSSSMVYGNFTKAIIDENSICDPLGIYGNLKFSGERLVIAHNQVFGLPYTIVRPSALYGERCISRRVSQIFIENLIDKKSIIIEGTGKEKLDFTYIKDLTHGVKKIIENKNSKNQIFNITYGKGRKIVDLVNILKKYFPDLKVEYRPKDKLMPKRGTLSTSKAKRLIGYNPSWPIEKGYVEYIKWYKNIFNQFRSK